MEEVIHEIPGEEMLYILVSKKPEGLYITQRNPTLYIGLYNKGDKQEVEAFKTDAETRYWLRNNS